MTRSRTLMLALVVAVLAIVAGFVIREPIERTLYLGNAARESGLSLSAGRLEHDGDDVVLDDFAARAKDDAFVVTSSLARIAQSDGAYDVRLEAPRVVVDPVAAARADFAATAFDVRVHAARGTFALVRDRNAPPEIAFAALDVAATVRDGTCDCRGGAALTDAGTTYPLALRTVRRADGGIAHALTAETLPLAPLAPFFASDGFAVRGGALHGVDVEVGPGVRADAHLDDGTFALGDRTLSHVRGALRYLDGKLGSRRLAGDLDAIPVDGAGEVDGLARDGSWLRDGSNDLRALASLARRIAAEPGVRSARIEATAPGVAYAQYALRSKDGPLAISVVALDPREPTLHLDTAIAENHVVSGGERTSAMGLRTGAVAGVNGDYFDIGRTYQPQGMLVRGGRLVRGPVDRAALVVDRAKRVRFGEFHLSGSVRTARGTMAVTEFNDWPGGQVAVVTADYGKLLPRVPGETFVALAPAGGRDRYRVTQVVPGGGIAPTFGIAIGRDVKVPPPQPGDVLTLSYRTDPPLRDAVAAIGGGPILVRDGVPYDDPHAPAPDEREYRWPVIALAREPDDALLLVAVDGRHPERSIGMKRPEFAELLLRFGAVDAMALDSGGSVTLIARAPGDANATVRNVPSDNSAERWVSDALFVYSDAPAPTVVPPAVAATPVPETRPTP